MITEPPNKPRPKIAAAPRCRMRIELTQPLRAKLAKLAKRDRTTPAQSIRDLIAAAK